MTFGPRLILSTWFVITWSDGLEFRLRKKRQTNNQTKETRNRELIDERIAPLRPHFRLQEKGEGAS